jgi:hypothetical protein
MVSLSHKIGKHQDRIEQLWREVRPAVSPYPKGVADVPEPIRGHRVFPGGLDLWMHEDLTGLGPRSESLARNVQASLAVDWGMMAALIVGSPL